MTSNKYSNYKIIWFNDKLKSLKDSVVTAPIYVRIKLTNKCFHNCSFCIYRSELWPSSMHNHMGRDDELSMEKVCEVLDDFKDMGVKAVTYSGGGEPLFHKDIVEILEKTKSNNVDLSIITNGQLLSGERAASLKQAKWVRVSMDYYDAQSFAKSRLISEAMYYIILDNISKFASEKDRACDLSVNFIVTKSNFEHIVEAAALLKSLGVNNVRFSPVWLDDFVQYHTSIQETVIRNLDLARERYESDSFKIYHSYHITSEQLYRSYAKCYIQQIIPSIGADYNVYNCHNKSYDEDAIIGNIKNQTFKQMWFSESTRRHFLEFNATEGCNCQCANDSKNRLLHQIIDCYGDNYV
jgi:MoaA/NifB/PqqE/SkfB family radical SAM enzyme